MVLGLSGNFLPQIESVRLHSLRESHARLSQSPSSINALFRAAWCKSSLTLNE